MNNQISLIRRREVIARTGIPRSTMYRQIAEGIFPQPVQIGARSVAWRSDDIEHWIASRTTGTRSAVERVVVQ